MKKPTRKKDKWMKWKIGAAGALGVAFLFHQVKESPAFAQATADANQPTASAGYDQPESKDPVWDEWGYGDDGGNAGGYSDRQGDAGRYSDGRGNSGYSSQPFAMPRTRTGRS